jgi:FkbM family methyltransferase
MAYRLYLNLRESDLMWTRFRGRYEVPKTRFLQDAIKSGMTVVDIGVNKGYFTLMAAALVGDHGRVHSFEPSPENCSWIRKSVTANGFGNISLHQMALSDTKGEAVLNLATTSGGHSILDATHARTGEAVSVATDTLDNVLSQHGVESIDVVKIDCEGAELLVLQGARDVFRKSESISVAMDIHPHYGIRPMEAIDWFTGNGFAVFDADNRPIRLDEITDESAITEIYAVKPPVASLR